MLFDVVFPAYILRLFVRGLCEVRRGSELVFEVFFKFFEQFWVWVGTRRVFGGVIDEVSDISELYLRVTVKKESSG